MLVAKNWHIRGSAMRKRLVARAASGKCGATILHDLTVGTDVSVGEATTMTGMSQVQSSVLIGTNLTVGRNA